MAYVINCNNFNLVKFNFIQVNTHIYDVEKIIE